MKKSTIVLVLFCAIIISLMVAGRFLTVDEQPQKADVIIILAGDLGARTERGVALWHEGYAPYIIVSGGNVYHNTNIGELMAEHAVELGVPRQFIIVEPRAHTTFQNAVYSKEVMQQHDFNSAIIVSSDYHMKRVRFIFRKVFTSDITQLTFCSVGDVEFSPDYWWTNNQSIMIVVNEYLRLIGYVLGRQL